VYKYKCKYKYKYKYSNTSTNTPGWRRGVPPLRSRCVQVQVQIQIQVQILKSSTNTQIQVQILKIQVQILQVGDVVSLHWDLDVGAILMRVNGKNSGKVYRYYCYRYLRLLLWWSLLLLLLLLHTRCGRHPHARQGQKF
jgi:hypothetical protein